MKQFKFFAALTLALAIVLPASATTVTWTGGANARFGFQQLNADPTNLWSNAVMSGLAGQGDLKIDYGTGMLNLLTAIGTTYLGGGTPTAQEVKVAMAAGWNGSAATFNAFSTGISSGTDAQKAQAAIAMALVDSSFAGHLDKDYYKQVNYVGLKNESSVRLAADIVSDSKKLTAKIDAKFATPTGVESSNETRPIDLQAAWVKYDLGMVAIKYNTVDLSNRWDADIIYVGDYTGHNSLDFTVKPVENMGYAFFTIMSDAGLDGVKYENTNMREISMFSAGYVYESEMIDATLGGVFDQKTKDGGDYTGYMAFAQVDVKSGKLGSEVGSFLVTLSGVYGQNVARFAGMDPADMEQATLGASNLLNYLGGVDDSITYNSISKGTKDSSVMGGHLSATYTAWMGGMINFDARISQCTLSDSDPYFSQRYTLAVIQALDENFFVTLAGGYEQYSVAAGDKTYDPAWGYEATLDFGYRF